MTSSELMFLALGLSLGVAAGATLLIIVRRRPATPREIRVTVATDAIPRRRAATLSDDAFVSVSAEPARGGPADRRQSERPGDPSASDPRTPVRPATVIASGRAGVMAGGDDPVGGEAEAGGEAGGAPRTTWPARSQEPPFRLTGPNAPSRAIPVSGGADPMLTALRASAAASAVAAMRTVPTSTAVINGTIDRPGAIGASEDRGRPRADGSSGRNGSGSVAGGSGSAASGSGSAAGSSGSVESGAGSVAGGSGSVAAEPSGGQGPAAERGGPPPEPCVEVRRLADERCELATRAHAQVTAAEEAHRAGQRAYEEHEAAAQSASNAVDPRAIRRSKDAAQARFRAGRGGSFTTEEVETAARAWLVEINAINARVREATAVHQRERAALQSIALDLERLALQADAARTAAGRADAACLAAREAAADCDEEAAAVPIGHLPAQPSMAPVEGRVGEDPSTGVALGTVGTPRVFRLLVGDGGAMDEMIAALGGNDAEARERWQAAIADLVDAIVADSIAASALEFPDDHPFWGPFTSPQRRDIASALSSLGYRFDGTGGWVDERIPAQRDLSLALGYAGFDPMRLRRWPTEAEMRSLFDGVTVAAAEHLVGAAGDLTLGELVSLLGRRADGLTEVWNQWGRIRPLLLEEA